MDEILNGLGSRKFTAKGISEDGKSEEVVESRVRVDVLSDK